MITINGIDIDFDPLRPSDIRKMAEAEGKAKERAAAFPPDPDEDSENYYFELADWMDYALKAFGNSLDDLFGDGVAEKLLTNNPSLEEVFDVNDAVEKAVGRRSNALIAKFEKYKPDRATR